MIFTFINYFHNQPDSINLIFLLLSKAESSNIKVTTVGDNINHWKGYINGPVNLYNNLI